jgi:hypothetical protein
MKHLCLFILLLLTMGLRPATAQQPPVNERVRYHAREQGLHQHLRRGLRCTLPAARMMSR